MEADEQREKQFIHGPKGNGKMDPAVHRLTNQTRKKKKHGGRTGKLNRNKLFKAAS